MNFSSEMEIALAGGPSQYTKLELCAAGDGFTSRDGKDKGKGQGKGKGKHPKGKSKQQQRQSGPYYHGFNPCGYFMAGCCKRGNHCTNGKHSYDYGRAFREHWLDPLDVPIEELLANASKKTIKSLESKDYPLYGQLLMKRDALTRKATESFDSRDTYKNIEMFYKEYFSMGTQQSDDAINSCDKAFYYQFVSFKRGLHESISAAVSTTGVASSSISSIKKRWGKGKAVDERFHEEIGNVESRGSEPPNTNENVNKNEVLKIEHAKKMFSPEYLLILDLEGKDEIIEFPVLVLHKGKEAGRFQQFVRPKHLFGEHVFDADCPSVPFAAVLEDFKSWLWTMFNIDIMTAPDFNTPDTTNLPDDTPNSRSYCFVTCGDWDCKHVANQCRISGITEVPCGFGTFINMKKIFGTMMGKDKTSSGMKGVMAYYGWLSSDGELSFGFHHSGMHDVENITMCMLRILDFFDGRLPITSTWPKHKQF